MQTDCQLIYYCFNPTCPLSDQRLFALNDNISHIHNSKCRKWIISHQEIRQLTHKRVQIQNKHREQYLMFSAPIQTILYYHQYQLSTKQRIEQTFKEYKRQINEMIQFCQSSFNHQFQCLKSNIALYKHVIVSNGQFNHQPNKELLNIHKEYLSKKIQISINSPIFNGLQKDIKLFDTYEIDRHCKEIKDNINKFFRQHFFMELSLDAQLQKVQFSDMVQVEKYMLQISTTNQASEKIYNLLNWNEGQYINQNEILGFKMKCPLCLFSTQLKPSFKKIGATKIMIDHLCIDHLPYLAMCFSHRMSKSSVYEIGLEEIIYLMKKYNYQQIDLIDANNSKHIYYEPKTKTLTILFTNDITKSSLFQHKYFKYSNPEEAAFAIIILIQYISNKGNKKMRIINFKRQYYNLLQSIISYLKLQNVKIDEKFVQAGRQIKQMGKIKVMLQQN